MLGKIFLIALELAGALALFMYGMQLTSDGIQRAAGDRLQKTVNFMTRNRFFATITGVLVTILIQSSSATTVMVVTFVNAGLLSLVQSIGVIMGANIGTTLTGWIIAAVGIKKYSIIALAVPIFGLGFFMSLMKKKGDAWRSYGEALMGFALIFLGLEFLAKAIPDPSGEALLFLQGFADKGWIAILVCVLVGAVFTMLINASSATIAIVIGMAAKGIITFEMAAAITLGANIGTTFDSFLVSLGGNTNAKRAAWAHIMFNIVGTVWVVAVFRPFLAFVDWITPGEINAATAGVHIAMLHTMFNTANTIVLFPFTRQYAALVTRLIKAKPDEAGARRIISYQAPLMATPELNLVSARKEISDMAGIARAMFARYRVAVTNPPADMEAEVDWFRREETFADQMQEELTTFLLETTRHDPSEKTQENIHRLLRVVDELENITDCCMNLIYLVERHGRKKLVLHEGEMAALEPFLVIAEDFLRFVEGNATSRIDDEQLKLASDMEDRIDAFRNELRKKSRKRLSAGAEVKAELLFMDMIRHIEKMGDHSFSIAEALREMR